MMCLEFDAQDLITPHGWRIWAGMRGTFVIDQDGDISDIRVSMQRPNASGWTPWEMTPLGPEDGSIYEDLRRALAIDMRAIIDEAIGEMRSHRRDDIAAARADYINDLF